MKIICKDVVQTLLDKGLIDDVGQIVAIDYGPPVRADIAFRISREIDPAQIWLNAVVGSRWVERAYLIGRYLNIELNLRELFWHVAEQLKNNSFDYLFGKSPVFGQRVFIEHTSINPVYPINIATFRSSAIGHALACLLTHYGADVETHFWVEDLSRHLCVILDGLRQLSISAHELGTLSGKPDHILGVIFATMIYTSRGVSIDEAHHLTGEMFPMADYHPNITSTSGQINRYDLMSQEIRKQTVVLCNYCIEGFRQTLQGCGIRVDKFDFESEELENALVSGLITELDYTYLSRNIAYYLSLLLRNCTTLISVVPVQQQSILESAVTSVSSLLGQGASERILLKFFGEVYVSPEGYDSISDGVFTSVDKALEMVSNSLSISIASAANALKFYLLDCSSHKLRKIDVRNPQTFSRFLHVYRTIARLRYLLGDSSRDYSQQLPEIGESLSGKGESDCERALLKTIALLPHQMSQALASLEPHFLTQYACDLASVTRRYIARIESEERDITPALLDLALEAFELTLANIGLDLSPAHCRLDKSSA